MSKRTIKTALLTLIVIVGVKSFALCSTTGSAPLRVFLLDARKLAMNKERIRDKEPALTTALAKLELDARKALTAGPFTITTKSVAPPSGDKHDYMSQAPYFWPDPTKPNGLPYIRRDGEHNPEIDKINNHRVKDDMEAAVETLALAYYFTGDEVYAAGATKLLRVFFLEPDTRMNPNLEYAQFIPGVNTGRGIGLIETRGLTRVIDAIGLIQGSKAWTAKEQQGMESWFSEFLKWMIESKNGRDESASKNNHGTYYDVQVCSFALFVGKREFAKQVLLEARQKRIALQIETDGRQPLELARTKAWGYSVMNLEGLMSLARLGESVEVDLWNFKTEDGRSIRRALEFLAPYAFGKKWDYQQLGEWPPQQLFPLIRRGGEHYNDEAFRSVVSKLPIVSSDDRRNLLG